MGKMSRLKLKTKKKNTFLGKRCEGKVSGRRRTMASKQMIHRFFLILLCALLTLHRGSGTRSKSDAKGEFCRKDLVVFTERI